MRVLRPLLLMPFVIVLTPLEAHGSPDSMACAAFSSDSCEKDEWVRRRCHRMCAELAFTVATSTSSSGAVPRPGSLPTLGGASVHDASATFAGAASWLVSELHVSQMGIILVFSSNPSLQRHLPPGMFPCSDRIVSLVDRKCFYFVEPTDLERGLEAFDLLTHDSPDWSYVAAAMLWDEALLAAADITFDELMSVLPTFTRVLLSKEVEMARAKEGTQRLQPTAGPQLSVKASTADSEPWAFYKPATSTGMQVQMRVTPVATHLSSADFVDGVCEALIEHSIGSYPMLCVAVWGYMYGDMALTQCGNVSSSNSRLDFSFTLPYGIVALGCALLEPGFNHDTRMHPVKQEFLAQWYPGFALRPGSTAVYGLPLGVLGRGSSIVYAMDGMKVSVAGSAVLDALRWSGYHDGSYHKKVADQKHVISQLFLQLRSTDATVLEVGCGGLTVGSWLIDTLNAYSYACVDVAPWAPTLILQAGLRTDRLKQALSGSILPPSDFGPKHVQIEGSAVCETKATKRGTMDLVFSFGALFCLSCNMLYTCLDNMAAALKPSGRIVITLPLKALGAANMSFVGTRQPLAMHYPPFQHPCASADATRRWAQSSGFDVSVIEPASLSSFDYQMSDIAAPMMVLERPLRVESSPN